VIPVGHTRSRIVAARAGVCHFQPLLSATNRLLKERDGINAFVGCRLELKDAEPPGWPAAATPVPGPLFTQVCSRPATRSELHDIARLCLSSAGTRIARAGGSLRQQPSVGQVHNSAARGGHGHTLDATTATVALRKRARRRVRRSGAAKAIMRPAPARRGQRDSDVAEALVTVGMAQRVKAMAGELRAFRAKQHSLTSPTRCAPDQVPLVMHRPQEDVSLGLGDTVAP
jgi:hypothetical protein